MLVAAVCLIAGCAYFACPFPIQLLLTAVNFFVPDPIPFLDEAIMVGGMLSKLYFLDNLWDNIKDFFAEHKLLTFLLILCVAGIVYYFIPRG